MLVSCFGFFNRLSGLLLRAHMIVSAVLLRGCPVSFRGLFVMFRGRLVHDFWHCNTVLCWGCNFNLIRSKIRFSIKVLTSINSLRSRRRTQLPR